VRAYRGKNFHAPLVEGGEDSLKGECQRYWKLYTLQSKKGRKGVLRRKNEFLVRWGGGIHFSREETYYQRG